VNELKVELELATQALQKAKAETTQVDKESLLKLKAQLNGMD